MTKDLSSCKKWLWNYNNSWDTLTLSVLPYETLCAIQYHLFTLKHVRDTHGEVICLGKKQALVCNFTKSSTPLWLFLNCSIILKHSIIYARNRCENEKKKNDIWTIQDIEKILDFHKISTWEQLLEIVSRFP